MSRRATCSGDLPLIAWGEELRRRQRDHRTRVRRWTVAVTPVIAAVAASTVLPITPRLVWNASASAPVGLYAVAPGVRMRRGDMVIAKVPAAVRSLAVSRRYIPINVPLVKHVGGVAGNTICASETIVTIEGKTAATRRAADGLGRPMPWWKGCRRIAPSEVFLLSPDAPSSFDGRYFGVSSSADIMGRATPLWTR